MPAPVCGGGRGDAALGLQAARPLVLCSSGVLVPHRQPRSAKTGTSLSGSSLKSRRSDVRSTFLFPSQGRACRLGFSPHRGLWGTGLGLWVGTNSRAKTASLTYVSEAVLALRSPGDCGFLTGFWSSQEGSWTSRHRRLGSVVEQGLGLSVPRPRDRRMRSLLTSDMFKILIIAISDVES